MKADKMRYIRRATVKEEKIVPVYDEGGTVIGEARVEYEYPDGLKGKRAIKAGQAGLDLDYWIVEDDVDVPSEDRAQPTDFPAKLLPGSPLDGMRLVPVVMSGMPDCVLDKDGVIVPAISDEVSHEV